MRHLTVLLTVTALSPFRVDAAECTDAEVAHDDDLWTWAASQPACAQYASGTTAFYWPCDATDCTAVLATMAASLSDCTYSGVSNKIEVQNAITTCTGATASNTDCVASEVSVMVDLYTAAATSDECADDSSVSATSIVITTFCGSACASKLEELATSLPNCYYGYQSENLKSDLLDQLDSCTGADSTYALNVVLKPEKTTEPPSTTSPPSTTTAPPATPLPETNSTSEPTPAPTQRDSATYC
ncbi:hypothetical protein PC111_g14229 [Phytophthora cactorum]|nr:hypothetical protein PC111_g14229 [Phytophthora cactorum]KAG2814443.1 hypothetical protein PC112_g14305 [Phytophthora cactorum]KAG3052921.1 hypothetical protein PC121_g17076 [Phytophthora cactorum]KAG3162965.1 hypothetical protein C6341_g13079 [Phytophthora cactorum]